MTNVMATVWPASCRARSSEVRRRRIVGRRRCRRRRGSPEAGAPGGVEVGEEGFVLLVGLERINGRGQVGNRLDRLDPRLRASSSVGTKSSAGHCSGCSGVLVTGHVQSTMIVPRRPGELRQARLLGLLMTTSGRVGWCDEWGLPGPLHEPIVEFEALVLGEVGVVLDVERREWQLADEAAGGDPGVVDGPGSTAEPGAGLDLTPDRRCTEAASRDDDAGKEA